VPAPSRIVATVVTASLADLTAPTLWAALSPDDRALAEGLSDRLRAGRAGAAAAEAIVAARASLTRGAEVSVAEAPGAMVYARWLRALDGAERMRVARGLDADSQAAVEVALAVAPAFEAAEAATAGWLIGVGAQTLGRMPTAREVAALLLLLRGEADVRDEGVVRWERRVRVAGRQRAAVVFARGVR
jgi:hypothetical protein